MPPDRGGLAKMVNVWCDSVWVCRHLSVREPLGHVATALSFVGRHEHSHVIRTQIPLFLRTEIGATALAAAQGSSTLGVQNL
jgi:hypothetical protein